MRGRVEDDPPKKRLEFGADVICPACKGKGYKNKHECWTCNGTKVVRKERSGE